jgi:hypothetical protein
VHHHLLIYLDCMIFRIEFMWLMSSPSLTGNRIIAYSVGSETVSPPSPFLPISPSLSPLFSFLQLDVLVFLDAHVVVSQNWLVPLAASLIKHPNAGTIPTN